MFGARRLTPYLEDDGQPISDVNFALGGNAIVYVRGEGKNAAGQFPNPTSNPAGTRSRPLERGLERRRAQKSRRGRFAENFCEGVIAYVRDGQIWIAPLDGGEKPKQLIVRGQNHSEEWSPEGSQLVFVSTRGDHGFIGLYDVDAKTVRFLAPSVDTDSDAVWSLDGKRIAFVRRPAERAIRLRAIFFSR